MRVGGGRLVPDAKRAGRKKMHHRRLLGGQRESNFV